MVIVEYTQYMYPVTMITLPTRCIRRYNSVARMADHGLAVELH